MRATHGFSLIEVMIAVALLAGALLALAQLTIASIASNTTARDATTAAVLAAEKVDELRSTPGPPVDGVDYIDQWGGVIGRGSSTPPGATYVRTWTVQSIPTSILGTIVIDVRVTRVGRRSADTRLTAAARVR